MSTQVCVWYSVCPIRRFTDAGRLDRYWVENYCLVANPDCERKKLESRGIPHPDHMLPDGTLCEELR